MMSSVIGKYPRDRVRPSLLQRDMNEVLVAPLTFESVSECSAQGS